jgi:hypothetical protein
MTWLSDFKKSEIDQVDPKNNQMLTLPQRLKRFKTEIMVIGSSLLLGQLDVYEFRYFFYFVKKSHNVKF